MDQRKEMELKVLRPANLILEKIEIDHPWPRGFNSQATDDFSILEINLRDAKSLLNEKGETNAQTILQMKQLAYLCSAIGQKYL